MPILSLQIDNFKRIETLYIEPDGSVIELTGANEAGKSSALDACAALLGGQDQISWSPIRDGAEEARIVGTIGGVAKTTLKVTRKIKTKKGGGITTTVTVESEDGARFPTPQTLLDTLINARAFDPLSFLRDDKTKQAAVLRQLVGLNTEEFDSKIETARSERADVNRTTNSLRAQAAAIMVPEGDEPKPIDESAIVDEMERAGEINSEIVRQKAQREAELKEASSLAEQASNLRTRAGQMLLEAEKLEKQADGLAAASADILESLEGAPAIPEPTDTSALRASIANAKSVNAVVDRFRRRTKILADMEKSEGLSKSLTEAISKLEADKLAATAAAKMPIDGLGFGEGVVTFKGRALSEASQAQQIRVSVAIAAALNPKLKVAFIRDGSLLDKKSWALLEQYATEHGLQVFVETVDSTRPTAIVIEDGKARAKPKLEAAE